jgi:hypothetical protein
MASTCFGSSTSSVRLSFRQPVASQFLRDPPNALFSHGNFDVDPLTTHKFRTDYVPVLQKLGDDVVALEVEEFHELIFAVTET